MDVVTDDLRAQLRKRVEQELEGLRITGFDVQPDRDHDGDPILRVEIVYDDAGGAPPANRMSALARTVRPWLDTQLPNTFPVFRFLTAREFADEAH